MVECCSRKGQIVWASLFSVIGIVSIIVGGVFPSIINKRIKDGVLKKNIISQDDMTEDDWKNFIEYNATFSAYAWNITNLKQAMEGTELLAMEAVGPYNFTKFMRKYNVSFQNDKNEIRFEEYTYFVQDSKDTKNADTDKFVVLNPVYLAALGKTGATNRGVYFPGDDASEGRFLGGVLIPSVFQQLAPLFLDQNAPFLSFYRLATVPVLMQVVMQVTGLSPPQLMIQWNRNGSACDTSCPKSQFCLNGLCVVDPSVWGGKTPTSSSFFEISKSIPDEDAQNLFCMTPSCFDFSFFLGAPKWMEAANIFKAKCNLTVTADCPLTIIFSQQFHNNPMVGYAALAWMLQTTAAENSDYRLAINAAIVGQTDTSCSKIGIVDSWQKLGLFQFYSGCLTSLIKYQSINTISIFAPSLPVPPEMAFLSGFDRSSYSVDKALSLLTKFQDPTQAFLTYVMTSSFPPGQPNSPLTVDEDRYLQYIAVNFGVNRNLVGGTFVNDVFQTLPTGTGTLNGGLFTVRTMSEILFGYKTFEPLVYQSKTPYPGPFGFNASSVDEDYVINSYYGLKYYERFTGKDDYQLSNAIKSTLGFENLTFVNQYPIHPCVPWAPPGFRRDAYSVDCKLWGESNIVTKTSEGTQFEMFTENDSPKDLKVWVNEARRVVNFVYEKDVEFEGITLRRYRIDEKLLKLSEYTKNNYFMTESYVYPMGRYMGGYDGFLSQPHFYADDPQPDLYSRGLNASFFHPSRDLHSTFVDIEPLTGRTMSARKRLQVGFSLHTDRLSKYNPWANIFQNFPANHSLYVPLAWAEEGKDISADDAKTFRDKIYGSRSLAKKLFYSLISVGSFIVVIGAVMFVRVCRAPQATSNLHAMLLQEQ